MTPLAYDRAYVWHPYASLKDPPPVRLVKSADGVNPRTDITTRRSSRRSAGSPRGSAT